MSADLALLVPWVRMLLTMLTRVLLVMLGISLLWWVQRVNLYVKLVQSAIILQLDLHLALLAALVLTTTKLHNTNVLAAHGRPTTLILRLLERKHVRLAKQEIIALMAGQ